MRVNRILIWALLFSIGWHLLFTLLFDLSLEEKPASSSKIIPVYYVGKGLRLKAETPPEKIRFQSVVPPFNLPAMNIIEPPLPLRKSPQVLEESLDELLQTTKEYRWEVSAPIEFEGEKKNEPAWILPEEQVKGEKKEYSIQWMGKGREVLSSQYPPWSEWMKEEREFSKVTLRFWASAEGQVKKVEIDKSSGSGKFDLLAMKYLRRWQFAPSVDGKESEGVITIEVERKNE